MTVDRPVSDVCVIVEGAYPFVTGGVASWLQELMASMPEVSFSIVAIKARDEPQPWRVIPPPNVIEVIEVPLAWAPALPRRHPPRTVERIGRVLMEFLASGNDQLLVPLTRELGRLGPGAQAHDIMASPEMFAILSEHYEQQFPAASFHHFFWAMRMLLGGLLAILQAPLPPARVYHTLSTGFAGLLATRARIETGRRAMLTEHGIYLLERQIEIMMVDWMGDQTEAGLVLERDAFDLTDLWSAAFESYARACYNACDPIIALYGANSAVQRRLGAARERLQIIPNGIRPERFAGVRAATDPAHPMFALIGRVVPIKDVKTFIRAAAIAHAECPEARFAVLGPEDEDAGYAAECNALVRELGIEKVFAFAGRVDVVEWLARIDVLVLTSLSEAQPLVILEAGACGIPAIAPDVGSCRELIEGSRPGDPHGGVVTALVDPASTAAAMIRLLTNTSDRRRMGSVMRERVHSEYEWSGIVERYRHLYRDLAADARAGAPQG